MLNDGAPNVGSAWIQDAFTQGMFIKKHFFKKNLGTCTYIFQEELVKIYTCNTPPLLLISGIKPMTSQLLTGQSHH